MKKDIKGLKEKLSDMEDQLAFVTPEQLKKYLKGWGAGLHRYSLNNYLLAAMQRPSGISILAGYRKWQTLGRQVARGEKALTILVPMIYKKNKGEEDEETGINFKPGNVFDISQTGIPRDVSIPITGERYKFLDMNDQSIPLGGTQNAENRGQLTMKEIIEKSPIPVIMEPETTISDGATNFELIKVSKRPKEASEISAYFHELGHNIAGHKSRKITSEVKEIEAEAISYLAGEYFGIENPDAVKYIKNWTGDKELLKGRGKKIISVVEEIISIFDEEEDT